MGKPETLEERVDRLESIIVNLAESNNNLMVNVKADKYYITIPLWRYLKEYCPDLYSKKAVQI